MLEWLELRTLILLGVLTIATIGVGLLRREPRWAIAMTTAGVAASWTGLFWAGALGTEALGPVFLTGTGMYLMTTAYERIRTRRATADAKR